MNDIRALIERIENADVADVSLGLDVDIFCRFFPDYAIGASPANVPGKVVLKYVNSTHGTQSVRRYTTDITDAIAFVKGWLPDWYWTAGRCDLTGHASVGPDYNSKKPGVRELLLAKFPVDQFHQGFDADLAPGGSDARVACALMHCALQALDLIEDMKGNARYAYSPEA